MEPSQPLFSIVIPTYNRPTQLERCLKALAQLNYERDRFEVIVVDDGSQTSLEPVAAPFYDRFHLTLVRQDNAGPAKARNTGASQAKGQFIVFTDDDCEPLPNWLQKLEVHCLNHPDCMVGGTTLNRLPDNLYSTASQVLIDYLYSYYNDRTSGPVFFASNNFTVPKETFRAIGCFDTHFPLAAGEDREFCDRWLHYGYRMIFAPEVQIYHAHRLTLASFWRQHFNYGRGAFYFHRVRAKRTEQGIKVEPLTFYSHLLTYPLTCQPWYRGLLLSSLLFLSQVANVAGFFWVYGLESGER